MKKLLLSSIICLGVLATNVAPAFADVDSSAVIGGQTLERNENPEGISNSTTVKDEDNGAHGTVGTNFTIDAKTTNVNVTVPTTAPFILDEDGNTLVPNNFKVKNNSAIAGIYLSEISLNSKNNEWEVVNNEFNLKTMPVDSKKIRVTFGKDGMEKLVAPTNAGVRGNSNTGSVAFKSGEIDIEAEQTQKLNFKIDRGAFSKSVGNATAFDMTLQFKFQ